MKLNLDSLLLKSRAISKRMASLFFTAILAPPTRPRCLLDTDRYPDYKKFLAAAEAAGAKLVSIHAREFNADILEDALDHAASAESASGGAPRDRVCGSREMGGYLGFTCRSSCPSTSRPASYVSICERNGSTT